MKKKKRQAFGGEVRRGRHRRSRGIFWLSSSLHLSETHRGKHCSCRGTIHLGTSKRCPDVQNWHTHNQLSLNNSTHRNTLMAGEKITHLTWNSHCTWHVPPIPICSHITLAATAVQLSHIICYFLAFLVLLCQKKQKKEQTKNQKCYSYPEGPLHLLVLVNKDCTAEPSASTQSVSSLCKLLYSGHLCGSCTRMVELLKWQYHVVLYIP